MEVASINTEEYSWADAVLRGLTGTAVIQPQNQSALLRQNWNATITTPEPES